MNKKEKLQELKNKLIEETPYLDKKVDAFINWHFKNFIEGNRTDIGEYFAPRDMRNLIEKMAVWYELKYPDYEINRMMPGSAIEENEITEEMKNVYDTKLFLEHLPWEESWYFNIPYPYDEKVYAYSYAEDPGYRVNLKLNKDGIITSSSGITEYSNEIIKDEFVIGLTLSKFYKLLKLKKMDMTDDVAKYVRLELDKVSKYRMLQEKLLDAIMYRIIERGGCRMGSRRAFLFAKEFDRNIDIPMKYIDTSDPGLGIFIDEYLKSDGNIELICYDNYGWRASDNDKIKEISLKDLIKIELNRNINDEVSEDLRKRLDNKELVKKL